VTRLGNDISETPVHPTWVREKREGVRSRRVLLSLKVALIEACRRRATDRNTTRGECPASIARKGSHETTAGDIGKAVGNDSSKKTPGGYFLKNGGKGTVQREIFCPTKGSGNPEGTSENISRWENGNSEKGCAKSSQEGSRWGEVRSRLQEAKAMEAGLMRLSGSALYEYDSSTNRQSIKLARKYPGEKAFQGSSRGSENHVPSSGSDHRGRG